MLRRTSLSVAVFAGLFANSAFAASTMGDAQVIIRSGLSITQAQSMNFGVIDHDATSQAVAMTVAGVVTCGTYTCTAGTRQQAQFTITGAGTATVNVTKVDGVLSDGAGNTIALAPTLPGATIALAAGTATLNVGGTFTPIATQVTGLYSTSNSGGVPYIINVNY